MRVGGRGGVFGHRAIGVGPWSLVSVARALAKVKKSKLPEVMTLVSVNPPPVLD